MLVRVCVPLLSPVKSARLSFSGLLLLQALLCYCSSNYGHPVGATAGHGDAKHFFNKSLLCCALGQRRAQIVDFLRGEIETHIHPIICKASCEVVCVRARALRGSRPAKVASLPDTAPAFQALRLLICSRGS